MLTLTPLEKTCSRCGVNKPYSEFAPSRETKLGLASACRTCDSERRSTPEYKAKAKERTRRHYEKNKEKCDRRSIEWAKARGYPAIKAWKQSNPERVKEQSKLDEERRLSDPIRRAKVYDKNARRRAKQARVTVGEVDRLKVFEAHGWICALCDQPVDPQATEHGQVASLDHIIPISKGGEHSMLNVQLAHQSCNSKKNNRIAGGV